MPPKKFQKNSTSSINLENEDQESFHVTVTAFNAKHTPAIITASNKLASITHGVANAPVSPNISRKSANYSSQSQSSTDSRSSFLPKTANFVGFSSSMRKSNSNYETYGKDSDEPNYEVPSNLSGFGHRGTYSSHRSDHESSTSYESLSRAGAYPFYEVPQPRSNIAVETNIDFPSIPTSSFDLESKLYSSSSPLLDINTAEPSYRTNYVSSLSPKPFDNDSYLNPSVERPTQNRSHHELYVSTTSEPSNLPRDDNRRSFANTSTSGTGTTPSIPRRYDSVGRRQSPNPYNPTSRPNIAPPPTPNFSANQTVQHGISSSQLGLGGQEDKRAGSSVNNSANANQRKQQQPQRPSFETQV